MPNVLSSDPDAGIQVAITPSQSAYFAGEPFSVTITFTNTRSPEAGPSKPSSYGHKRGAHSISSAPLARPPTSPGTPRTPVTPLVAQPKSHTEAPMRRGLVGINSEDKQYPELTLDQRRKRLLAKSLSVSIAPPELDAELSQTPSAGSHQRTFLDSGASYRSPLVPTTIPRTGTLALSQNHPHVRKPSVVDSQYVPESSTYPPIMSPSSSTSSFSLALDSIAETSMGVRSSYPNTPILGSPSIEPASPSRFHVPVNLSQNSIYGYPPSSASSSSSSLNRSHRPSNLGHGYPTSNGHNNGSAGHPLPSRARPPAHLNLQRSAFSASFPHHQPNNSELILYSYAQLMGSVVIIPVPGATLTQDQMNNMTQVRESLLKRSVVGGGSMDINSSLLNRTPSGGEYPISPGSISASVSSAGSVAGKRVPLGANGHGRTSSLTGALLSILSPSALIGSSANSPDSPSSPGVSGRWRSSSASAVSSLSSSATINSEIGQGSPRTANDGFPGSGQGVGLGLEMGVEMGHVGQSSVVSSSSPYASTTNLSSAGLGRSRRSTYTSAAASHGRRSSVAWILGGGDSNTGTSGIDPLINPDSETPLPTFEVQPAMLAVDLSLAPGESRSYTYTVNLPDNLPPTFRGKAVRFSYELVVGLCRAGQSSMGLTPTNSEHSHSGSANVSKLMKVPIRMYNNVVVDRAPKPYNLLWPMDRRKDLAMPGSQAKVVEKDVAAGPTLPIGAAASAIKSPTTTKGKAGLDELVQYTKRLLESLPAPPTPTPTPPPPPPTLPVPDPDVPQAELSPPAPSTLLPEPELPSSLSAPLDTGVAEEEEVSREQGQNHKSAQAEESSSSSHDAPSSSSSSTSLESPSTSPSDSTATSPVQTGSETSHDGNLKIEEVSKTEKGEIGDQKEGVARDDVDVPPTDGAPEPKQAPPTPAPLPPRRQAHRKLDSEDVTRDGMLTGGCREAVEILTRTQKKASYDVTKDGVKVAVLTFPKSSYRLGETINGVVEINERKGRARVLQLSAFLEAHESLPSTLLPASANRHLRRAYADHFSSYLLNTLRTTFSLDIPSDASPAFQTYVGTPKVNPNVPGGATSFGGVEWKVRLCLLVGVVGEDTDAGTEGVRFKSMARDGPRGEWGSEWKALDVACPLEKEKPKPRRAARKGTRPASLAFGSNNASSDGGSGVLTPPMTAGSRSSSAVSWGAFFASYLSPSSEREYHDGDDLGDDEDEEPGYQNSKTSGGSSSSFEDDVDTGYDGIKPDLAGGVGQGVDFGGGEEGWREVRLEMVECEVPVRVWPGNTAFKAMDVVFEV